MLVAMASEEPAPNRPLGNLLLLGAIAVLLLLILVTVQSCPNRDIVRDYPSDEKPYLSGDHD